MGPAPSRRGPSASTRTVSPKTPARAKSGAKTKTAANAGANAGAGAGAKSKTAAKTGANAGATVVDDVVGAGGAPASRRALRNQGRRTMRKLLDAAMEAFDRRGYHATRVNDVVEIAKTSHGTFYLYFSNKEDLLRALVAEAAAESSELYALLGDPPAGGTDWANLREWVGRYSSLWVRYAPLLRAWTDLASIDPDLGDQVRQIVATMSGALSSQIASAQPVEGVDADAAGMAVLAMLDRFHYLREFVGRPVDNGALDTLTTIIHRALFA